EAARCPAARRRASDGSGAATPPPRRSRAPNRCPRSAPAASHRTPPRAHPVRVATAAGSAQPARRCTAAIPRSGGRAPHPAGPSTDRRCARACHKREPHTGRLSPTGTATCVITIPAVPSLLPDDEEAAAERLFEVRTVPADVAAHAGLAFAGSAVGQLVQVGGVPPPVRVIVAQVVALVVAEA